MLLSHVRTHAQRRPDVGFMQKKLFIILFSWFIAGINTAYSADFYVSTSGSNNNDGNENTPWQTVSYAASNVPSGSTIYVSAGVYAESSIIQLLPDVNLIGDDPVNTIITTAAEDSIENQNGVPILVQMHSSLESGNVVVDGNQTISNITFDCKNHVVSRGIELTNRNNVTFDQITIKDCHLRALYIKSTANVFWSEIDTPSNNKLVANITIKNSTFKDSGRPVNTSWSYGAVQIEAIRDSVIHHNTFDESNYGGFNIKSTVEDSAGYGTAGGGNRIKIHNNIFMLKKDAPNTQREKGFGVEFWNLANSEVYDNWTNGGFSIAMPGTSNTKIHHNTFDMSDPIEGKTLAIEIGGHNNEIYSNYMDSTGPGIAIWASNPKNLRVHNNILFKTKNGIFISAQAYHSPFDFNKDNISIDNNTIDSTTGLWGMAAIGARIQDVDDMDILPPANINNLTLRNNIISNTINNHAISLTGLNANTIDVENIIDTAISNNLYHNNYNISEKHRNDGYDIDDAGSTTPIIDDSLHIEDPLYTGTGNTLGSQFQLTSNSPAINTGENVGYPYLGTYPDKGAFVQDRSIGARIEAEMNYSVAEDVSTKAIAVTDRGMDSNKSVNIFDAGDTIRIHFYVPTTDVYSIQVRLRSGNINGSTQYFDIDGYGFMLDGVTPVPLIGDIESISDYDTSGGGIYWGTMKGNVSLDAGRHSLEIRMNYGWGMVDYMELHKDSDFDGVVDLDDNCPIDSNTNQLDTDADGLGDECDSDIDGDGDPNQTDCQITDPTFYHGATEIKHDGFDQDCNGYDLTIDIIVAKIKGDNLIVRATSSYGTNASLSVIDYSGMKWRSRKQDWKLKTSHDGSPPLSVIVTGIEGSVTTAVTQ